MLASSTILYIQRFRKSMIVQYTFLLDANPQPQKMNECTHPLNLFPKRENYIDITRDLSRG